MNCLSGRFIIFPVRKNLGHLMQADFPATLVYQNCQQFFCSIEDTSVDPSQKPGVRNEVIAELAAAKNPMGASDQPVTVTDRDPSFTASEWGSKEEE